MQTLTESRAKKILEEIKVAGAELLRSEPFYGHLFEGIERQVSEHVKRASLVMLSPDAIIMLINPSYWEGLDGAQHIGVIKHQLLHLSFKHPARVHQFENKKIFDLACDVIVNQFLKSQQLTADAVTALEFGLPLGQSLDYYYHQLMLQEIHSHCVLTSECGPLAEHQMWMRQVDFRTSEVISCRIDQLVGSCTRNFSDVEESNMPIRPYYSAQTTNCCKPVVYWRRIVALIT